MAYRSRRSYRSTRRTPKRKYTWVRSLTSSTGVISDTSVIVADLLWTARQPPSIPGALADSGPGGGGATRAATDTSLLPALDLQDIIVERIRGSWAFTFTSAAGTDLLLNMTMGVTADTGGIIGVQSDTGTSTDYGSIDPAATPAAMVLSWMFYRRYYLFAPDVTTGQIGTGGRVCSQTFDVKTRRRLRDWGDTCYAVYSFAGLNDSTGMRLEVNQSVLISHR